MSQKALAAALFLLLSMAYSSFSYAEREDLEDSPDLKDLIQQKFEDIKQFRSRLHRWERSIRGFRRDHNFSLGIGAFSGAWEGTIPRENVNDSQQEILSFLYDTDRYIVRGSYSFHLDLGSRFGYFIGTGFGVSVSESAKQQSFEEPGIYELPGINLGLVWNISPAVRLSLAGSLHLVRIDRFYHETEEAVTTAIGESQSIAIDLFITISSGIRVEYENYAMKVDGGNDVLIKRHGKGVTLSWVRHLI
ncbi:hypothetical protein [Pseudobacteriovorax antillogorgiicola]|uniref:Outer membrane protein beta-barrel domain-containing protein n=1 Tax=Pseudobacteriovorax antillogorgiicola TaxID=1513793 RepID=A0A1Y6B3Q6_9BACT|nr:hypothetical protein [Pseudobacteriovorax antillogorgiicola]TCS59497.1 hypothetical protein EDD56_101417 [Pseudobacteriovorax antillogorgiicola]SME87907.1 hypothetical protein SAMN06296036_10168 [Pseudobacteriovorax antillogorgiicola]